MMWLLICFWLIIEKVLPIRLNKEPIAWNIESLMVIKYNFSNK